jgi:hypothetical protein
MPIAPLRNLVKGLLLSIGVLLVLIGIVLFLSGFNAYINPDEPDVQPFEQILLAAGFLGIPASGFLFYKARKSLIQNVRHYGVPDAPGRSFLLTLLSVTTAVLTISAFVIALTVF